jgi:hypothetical protein
MMVGIVAWAHHLVKHQTSTQPQAAAPRDSGVSAINSQETGEVARPGRSPQIHLHRQNRLQTGRLRVGPPNLLSINAK